MKKTVKAVQSRKLVFLTGLMVFLLECAAGFYYNVYIGYYHTDGISRVANAFYVLYSRNPHLGAIGLVWNPLPSIVDLFILFLYPWIPALATKGIAGLLMCAIFAALTAIVTTSAFIKHGLSKWSSITLTLLFSLNPMIFLFGFNGMSDAPFMFFVILCIVKFLDWTETSNIGDLAIASFALALSFWCRYEAVPFGFGLIFSTIIVVTFYRRYNNIANESRLRSIWYKIEGTLLVIATPLIYSGVLWIILNAVIMHNPFYFLNGEYTNTAQITGHLSDPKYAIMLGNPLISFSFAFKKILFFSSPIIAIFILKLLNKRILKWDTLIFIGLLLSIPMLQILMLIKGTSLGWLRYFIYVLPVAFAWLPYEISKIKHKWQISIPIIAMIVNFGVLSYAITQPDIAPDENTFLQNSFGNHSQVYYEWVDFTEIAKYLDENYPKSPILTDSFSSYFIILQSKNPKRFFISSDYEFKNAISDPIKYGVDYLLIPKPGSASVISAINNAYPDLYNSGADWAEEVKSFENGWKLFKISKSTGVTIK